MGKDRSKKYWRKVIDELIGQQCLEQSNGQYSSLKITQKGVNLLRGDNKFYIIRSDYYHYIEIVDCLDINDLYKIGEYEIEYSSNPVIGFDATGYRIEDLTQYNNLIFMALTQRGLEIIGEDFDNDGAVDAEEQFFYLTDETDSDTDDDGMLDGYEIKMGLNPLDALDVNLDPDTDGLDNLQESQILSDPFNKDTDFDNLDDAAEISYGTNPIYHDSDMDGLSDGFEIKVIGTDPLNMDTDRDTINDFMELAGGTNPLVWSRFGLLFGFYLLPVYLIVIIGTVLVIRKLKRRVKK